MPLLRSMWDALRRAGRWAAAHPLVVSAVWALWLSALYGVFGPHSYVRIHDNADSLLAMRAGYNVFANGWGWLSAWARGWASGVDRGVTGLDALPFVFLPGWLAYFLVMFAQRLVAAYFGFRLMKDRIGVGAVAAFFTALLYSAYIQANIQTSWAGWTLYDGLTLAAVPLVLWLLLMPGISRRRLLTYAAIAGALYALTTIYAFAPFALLLVVVVLVASGRSTRDAWLAFGVFVVGWLAFASPGVIAGLLSSQQSQRAAWAATGSDNRTFGAQLLLSLNIAKDNWLGLALGTWAIVATRERRALLTVLAALVALAGVGLALQGQTLLSTYGGPLAGFQFQRLFLLVPLLVAFAGGLGIEALTKAGTPVWAKAVAALAFAVVLVASVSMNVRMAGEMMAGENWAVVFDDPVLVRLGQQERAASQPFRIVTVAVQSSRRTLAVDPGYAWAQGIDTADGYFSVYPKRFMDYWGHVIGPIAARDAAVRSYYFGWGNRIYVFAPFSEKMPVPAIAADYWDLELLAFDNVRYVVSPYQLSDPELSLVSSPGVQPQPLMSRKRWFAQLTGSPVVSRYYEYELTDALPRAFVAGSAQSFTSRAVLLDAMNAAPVETLAKTVYFESADGPLPQVGGTGTAGPYRISGDSRTVDVHATGQVALVVTEQYNRFWTAQVDGAPAKVVPADCAFMAVPVPSGDHVVTLSYRPPYALPLTR